MARPREFDEDEVLHKAMQVFWQKGYYDSSIRDLIAATGVNQYGLYSAFRDKHGLYAAALDLYRQEVTESVLDAIAQPGPIRFIMTDAYKTLLRYIASDPHRPGCMMCNAAVELALHDAQTAEKVRAHMTVLRKAIHARLKSAQTAGDLSGELDLKALSEFFATTAYTLGVLVRAGQSRGYLERHIKTTVDVLN